MKAYFALFFSMIICYASQAQTMKWNQNPVIAHRGAFKKNQYPENSIASLKESIRLKCYGSEFDVHMTRDGIMVVNHDADFYGIDISSSTYKELLAKKLPNGESIPTLEAFLKEGMKQKKTKLILELKPAKTEEEMMKLTDAAVKMVHDMKATAWIEYISFHYGSLKRILELDPKATVAFLASVGSAVSAEKLKEDKFAGADYHYSVYKANPGWFEEAHRLGLTINGWTVNKEEDLQWMLENKADYITTNEPELLFELLAKKGK
ncbi:glycerophosphoryl diester phosphodiesterase [Arcticibacter pallidicorallinus]|uniref:Glycerophosphoryl diester phosphodiesterase n=1 Tax=Arcticibacter pallidicorallinus TaxID=1259464 RepID=A0A2T0U4U1_9SPHI|nr:glycerophosphodiester phosphodiesterase family protein [Arcticibacter pallidicorallinus]PRY52858.1 glycerophosphoryl diester phosphodiesterase [Arcticibacter pallidicorallinus]